MQLFQRHIYIQVLQSVGGRGWELKVSLAVLWMSDL